MTIIPLLPAGDSLDSRSSAAVSNLGDFWSFQMERMMQCAPTLSDAATPNTTRVNVERHTPDVSRLMDRLDHLEDTLHRGLAAANGSLHRLEEALLG